MRHALRTHATRILAVFAVVAVVVAAAASCSINRKSSQYECTATSDCDPGRACEDGLCVLPGGDRPDAPRPPNDGGRPDGGDEPDLCPSQCTECSDAKVCTIDCAAGAACDQAIACPPGWHCLVRCNLANACRSGVDCTESASCDIQCTGNATCRELACGPGRCNVNCTGNNSCRGVDCGDACACDVRCALGVGCSAIQCTALSCVSGLNNCSSQRPNCNTCQ